MSNAEEDVYAAFSTPDAAANPWTSNGNAFAVPPPPSSGGNPIMMAPPSQWGHTGMGSAWGVPGSRLGTMGGGLAAAGAARPMTSNRAVGFGNQANGSMFDPTGQGMNMNMALGPAPPLKKRSENSPEELCMEMERQVNKLIEESAMLALQKDYGAALEKAKDAGKKERQLRVQREQLGLADQINVDLTYAVHFNLAVQYQNHQLYTEALNMYNLIIRNSQFPQAGRLRVNMGNIYAAQKKYLLAIKMYRMTLDETPTAGKELRYKLFRNIGNAFVKMGQYRDAANSYEAILEGNGDVNAGFNLLICYYALGETEKLKRTFGKMLNSRPAGLDDDEEFDEDSEEKKDVLVDDGLRKELKERRSLFLKKIITAARLIAPVLDKDWRVGYDYLIEQLRHYEMRDPSSHVASELEMCKYLNYLKHKRYQDAISGLKAFEKKDKTLRARAATNLAYLYFLEGDYDSGEKYSDMSLEADQYNAKALVNKGNFYFVKDDFDKAKEYYNRALSVEADNVEAIYNLGLTAKRLGLYEEAVKMFKRVQTLVDSSEVLYQIADIHDLVSAPSALEWFNRLIGRVPTDPNALARVGSLYAREGDDTQAFHYYLEAYRYYQVNMDVISWLGAYFVKNEVYDKAMQFFARASHIQPQEAKWQLMVASCLRRRGDYAQAKRQYETIHQKYPDNVECLKYLVQICKDTAATEEANEWFKEMKKVERKQLTNRDSSDDEDNNSIGGSSSGNFEGRGKSHRDSDDAGTGGAAEGDAVAGRRGAGAAERTSLAADVTAGLSDDEGSSKKKKSGAKAKKEASESDDEIDLPGV